MGTQRRGIADLGGLLLAFALASSPARAQPSPAPSELVIPGLPALPELPTLSPWDTVFTFQSSAGYKDNVALSATRPSGSAFLRNVGEAIVLRLPVDGWEFNAFVSGEDTRYLDSRVVDMEQGALAHAQLKKTWAESWSAALAGQHVYQNQVVDLSTSLATPTVLRVESHTTSARLAVRRTLTERAWLELEPTVARQNFSGPLDDFWESGGKLSLGRGYGHRSEVVLSGEASHRPFDQRSQFTRAGTAIPGTELAFVQHREQLTWKHHWDEARHWRTTTKLGHEASLDNGTGYFDFRRWHVSQQWRWAAAPWEVAVTGRFAASTYPHQPVAAGAARAIDRTDFLLALHVERALGKRVRWFLDHDFERVLSNQPATGYAVNKVHTGFSVEF